MKQKRIWRSLVWCAGFLTLLAVPVAAAEAELAEARSVSVEWLALGFSSAWALVLQLLRLRK